MLEVSGLDAYYGRAHILAGVDLSVGRGEVVVLLGRNGAGKTTTMKSIMGLVRPTAGAIAFDGRSLNGLAPHVIARQVRSCLPGGLARAGEQTAMVALEQSLDPASDGQVEAPESIEGDRVHQRPVGIDVSNSTRMSSTPTPSATASKDKISRWLRTSYAMS